VSAATGVPCQKNRHVLPVPPSGPGPEARARLRAFDVPIEGSSRIQELAFLNSGSPFQSEGKPATVFLVEDEPLVALEIADRLRRLGYEVLGRARSAEQALDDIAASPPDLVLMDIRLAGKLSGIEAAATLRRTLGVPVVFVTTYCDATTLRDAGKTHPFGFLVKPIEEHELHATLQIALARSAAERSALCPRCSTERD